MIRIELEPAVHAICECCNVATTRLTRFVYQDDDAYGIYYAVFGEGHDEIKAIVAVGGWCDGTTPADRVAFPMILWQNANEHAVTLVDRADSPWMDVALIGEVLDRDVALEHPRLSDVFHLTDHIFAEDPEIRAFLARRAES